MMPNNYRIFYYQTGSTNPIQKFINKLPSPTQSKIKNAVRILKIFGKSAGHPHIKFLKNYKPLFEVRILGVNSIRLIACQEANQIFILHIFKKKTMAIPQKELKTAFKRFQKSSY